MKIYAVRNGRNPGIYNTWEECKEQVCGFSGAVFKSFGSLEEAENYIKGDNKIEPSHTEFEGFYKTIGLKIPKLKNKLEDGNVLVYVDGSVNPKEGKIGFGYLIYYEDKYVVGYGYKTDEHLLEINNIGGELFAMLEAINEIDKIKNVKKIEIRYDYKGIEEWATESWKAKKSTTRLYSTIMHTFIEAYDNNVLFTHIKGHSGEQGNECVDKLAKIGCGILSLDAEIDE